MLQVLHHSDSIVRSFWRSVQSRQEEIGITHFASSVKSNIIDFFQEHPADQKMRKSSGPTGKVFDTDWPTTVADKCHPSNFHNFPNSPPIFHFYLHFLFAITRCARSDDAWPLRLIRESWIMDAHRKRHAPGWCKVCDVYFFLAWLHTLLEMLCVHSKCIGMVLHR